MFVCFGDWSLLESPFDFQPYTFVYVVINTQQNV